MRRRRIGAKWAFAQSTEYVLTDNAIGGNIVAGWLLPVGWTDWHLEQRNRGNLVYSGGHFWADFHWSLANSESGASHAPLPDVSMWIMKAQAEPTSGLPVQLDPIWTPWASPGLPKFDDWGSSSEEDGTASLLWCHRIKGFSPPNSIVRTDVNIGPAGSIYNQNNYIAQDGGGGTSTANVCRTFSCRQEWQPDFIVRAKRRLIKGEGIAFYMRVASDTGVNANLSLYARHLVRG